MITCACDLHFYSLLCSVKTHLCVYVCFFFDALTISIYQRIVNSTIFSVSEYLSSLFLIVFSQYTGIVFSVYWPIEVTTATNLIIPNFYQMCAICALPERSNFVAIAVLVKKLPKY